MKITKSHITVITTLVFGILLLVLQEPITNSLVKKSDKIDKKFSPFYTIKNTYNLPKILDEISGITWLSENTFACIQDEDGIIFIYNIAENKIKKEINFAKSGDYEAIAINDNDAYVMRSDGLIYEIKNYNSDSLEVSKSQTLFNKDHDIESLTYDKQNNRLLTTPKSKDLGKKQFKSIYQIALETMQMDSVPIVNINLKAEVFKEFQNKKIRKTFRPSGMAIHPKTNDIYILEGVDPKLLILNFNGDVLKIIPLDKRKFGQPEGITFSDDGRLFISNEATGDKANIIELELN